MLTWNQLHQDLEKSAKRHRQLFGVFERFAQFVAEQVSSPSFHINGITASPVEDGFFTVTFAGRILLFAFSSTAEQNGALSGNVDCYLKKNIPVQEHVLMGSFSFTSNGKTNLKEPEENDFIVIDCDFSCLYVALHFIHESIRFER